MMNFIIDIVIMDQQSAQWHHSNLHKLCRVCGEILSAAGRVRYLTSSERDLPKRVFCVEVERDNAEIHPSKYCHRRRGVVYHATKKGGTDGRISVVTAQSRWMQYTCITHTVQKVGRRQKRSARRPQRESIRALIMHT